MKRNERMWRVLAVGALVAASGLAGGVSAGSSNPCARATSVATLSDPKEPGEPLLVTGRVFAADGTTPAAGVVLFVYHTDAKGHYNRWPGSAPRLKGWMKTGPDGRYEYRTIRPGAYPGGRTAAHVHTQMWGAGRAAAVRIRPSFRGRPSPDGGGTAAVGRVRSLRVHPPGAAGRAGPLERRPRPPAQVFRGPLRGQHDARPHTLRSPAMKRSLAFLALPLLYATIARRAAGGQGNPAPPRPARRAPGRQHGRVHRQEMGCDAGAGPLPRLLRHDPLRPGEARRFTGDADGGVRKAWTPA